MSKAPFNDLQDIAQRKKELKSQIKKQEKILSRDFDDYQEDVDTFKNLWERVKRVRNVRQNAQNSGIVSGITSLTNKKGIVTAVTVGAKIFKWLWQRKK